MRDVGITWDASALEGVITFDPATNDLASDEGLRTATIISLFTDARAREDDPLPDDIGVDDFPDRRGCWMDETSERDDDSVGSRLWLLDRAKVNAQTLRQAERYAVEALQWMVDEGIAAKIKAVAEWGGPTGSWLFLQVSVLRSSGGTVSMKFDNVWKGTQ